MLNSVFFYLKRWFWKKVSFTKQMFIPYISRVHQCITCLGHAGFNVAASRSRHTYIWLISVCYCLSFYKFAEYSIRYINELLVGSNLGYAAIVKYGDPVCWSNRRKTVSDDKRCAVSHESLECFLYKILTLGIQSTEQSKWNVWKVMFWTELKCI